MQNRLSKLAVIAVIAAAFLGCGKAEYESKMKSRATSLKLGSRFLENLHLTPNDILGGAASLQLPLYIDEDAKIFRMGAKTRTGNRISRDRIQPPSVNIPGFDFCYERFENMGGVDNLHPVYWYFGSAPASAKLKAIENKLRAETAKMVPNSKPTFVDVSLDTPTGGKLAFRKLSVKGRQAFNTDPDVPDMEKRAGQFDLYIHSTSDRHVIIAIRGSDEVIQKLDAITKGIYALGTLEVESGES